MSTVSRAASLLDDYLLVWVLASVAVGFPPIASLPAVLFGFVEIATSAGLARWFRRASD